MSVVFIAAWAETFRREDAYPLVLEEVMPPIPYHADRETMMVPYVESGILYLAEVTKQESEVTKQGSKLLRKKVATDVYRLADINDRTGQYVYQTLEGIGHTESATNVVTWVGDTEGNIRRVYKGAGEVKLSPGGSYLALKKDNGVLHVANLGGTIFASFGAGNTPVFSDDSMKLAFFRSVPYSIDDAQGIAVVDLRSGEIIASYYPDGKEYFPLAFTEDGNTLFFTSADNEGGGGVNVLALPVDVPNGEPQLITVGETKLPYIVGYRVLYDSNREILYLGAEGKMWAVDISSGDITMYNDTALAAWTGRDAPIFLTGVDTSF
jgi:hypothetical protein